MLLALVMLLALESDAARTSIAARTRDAKRYDISFFDIVNLRMSHRLIRVQFH